MTHAIIGKPVNHSLSPKIYNYLFNYFEIDSDYGISEDLTIINELNGCNITYPFKKDAFILCDNLTKQAQSIGSVNTIINRNGKLKGTNTDGIGFVKSISKFKDVDFILIIGAGATAKAASIALTDAGYIVAVTNRSSAPLLSFENGLVYPFNSYNDTFEPDLVVNMTPVGLEDNELPFASKIEEIIDTSSVVIDLIYNKETELIKLAKSKGKIVSDGKDLLLAQAALAFQFFTDYKISIEEIDTALEKLVI